MNELSQADKDAIVERLFQAYEYTKLAHGDDREVTLGGNGLNSSEVFSALKWIIEG